MAVVGRSHLDGGEVSDPESALSATIAQVLERSTGGARHTKRKPYTLRRPRSSGLPRQGSVSWVPIPTRLPRGSPPPEETPAAAAAMVAAANTASVEKVAPSAAAGRLTGVSARESVLGGASAPVPAPVPAQGTSFFDEQAEDPGPAASLRAAVTQGDTATVIALVSAAVESGDGSTAESILGGSSPPMLVLAATVGNAPMVKALLALGGSTLLDTRTRTGETALHAAAVHGSLPVISALLEANPRAVHIANGNGSTALHHAARLGHAAAVALLLERGSDPRRTDDLVGTPLHYAAQGLGPGQPIAENREWIELLQALLTGGAALHPPLSIDDRSGVVPREHRPIPPPQPLLPAEQEEDQEEEEEKVVQRGWTPLHRACYAGQWRIVAGLVKAGADDTVPD